MSMRKNCELSPIKFYVRKIPLPVNQQLCHFKIHKMLRFLRLKSYNI